jgi:hypothetical protein
MRFSRPARAFGAVMSNGVRPALRQIVGVSLTEPEIRRRLLEMPVSKAQLGAMAVREGMAADDTALLQFGGAMVVRALDDAIRNNDMVVQAAVTDVVASLPVSELTDNPLISPEDVARASPILHEAQIGRVW